MNSILKKTERDERRIRVTGICAVRATGSAKQHFAKLVDISNSGMSFHLKEPAFNEKTTVEVDLRLNGNTLTIRGSTLEVPEDLTGSLGRSYRYSILFQCKLREEQLLKILENLDLHSAEKWG